MGRLKIKNYKPEHESSPSLRMRAKKTGELWLLSKEQDGRLSCPCGCGKMPAGKKSTFAMGHDARLRGMLQRAHLTDTLVVEVLAGEDAEPTPVTAKEVAERHGWMEALEQAELAREGKNRQVLNKAMGSDRLIKVGRWEYTGQVVAIYQNGDEHYEIEYVTKTGDVRRTRVKASEAKEVG